MRPRRRSASQLAVPARQNRAEMAHRSTPAAGRSPERTRLAIAGWRAPHAGLAHGFLDLDVTAAEEWCRASGVSVTHLVGASVGRGLAAVPDLNARVVLGRARRRPSADVSFAVTIANGGHLTAVLVRNADAKHPREIARELFAATREARRGGGEFGRTLRIARRVPRILLRPAVSLAGFITAGLGLPLRPVGLQRHPFGSALVSAIGTFGVDRALAPLLPFARVGSVVTIGRPLWTPRVVDGEIVPRRVVELGVTVDHRLVDGAQAAALAAILRSCIERPWETWPAAASRPEPVAVERL